MITNRAVKSFCFGPATKTTSKRKRPHHKFTQHQSAFTATANLSKSLVNFKLQLGRDQTKAFCRDAHEGRFAYLSTPCKVLGSYHFPTSPDFSKVKARDGRALYFGSMNLMDYSPLRLFPSGPSCTPCSNLIVVKYIKTASKSSKSAKKSFVPEYYPEKDIARGFDSLGHVKRQATFDMRKMVSRNSKGYNRNMPANYVQGQEEKSKVFGSYSKILAETLGITLKP